MKQALIKVLYNKIKKDKALLTFIKNLMEDNELYLFGGAVRDYLENNLNSFRDLDFVVKSKYSKNINIENYIPAQIKFKRNRYNGYKINFADCIVDIWDIENTWAFKNNKLHTSVENLLNSVYLNIDSLLYLLNENKYINNCDIMYKNIKLNKQLDIICQETPFETLNLLRAIIYKNKYSLEFSDNLIQQFHKYFKDNNSNLIDEFMQLQKEHYDKYVINKADIYKEIDNIKNIELLK